VERPTVRLPVGNGANLQKKGGIWGGKEERGKWCMPKISTHWVHQDFEITSSIGHGRERAGKKKSKDFLKWVWGYLQHC